MARGLAVDEIALVVAAPRLDDGEIGGQPRLENIALAAEDFFLFAFGDDRADARARIEADDARAAGAQPLGGSAEERRVGQECVSTCRSRRSPGREKK